MKILITGVAGFVGFSLAKDLSKNNNYIITGLDSLDNYYSPKLKKKRIQILQLKNNFFFKKIDITDNNILIKFLKKKKFDYIFHFAAQAGVRHTVVNPKKYIDVNIVGFFNILQFAIKTQPKKFFYASSSSVYGDTSIFPTEENTNLKPKNIYGLTKKFNEEIINLYSSDFKKTKLIGLRFFTVYGEWGRPDMLLIKFMTSALKKIIFKVHNYGSHIRDFTYIADVINVLNKLIKIKIEKNHTIINICSSRPILLSNVITKLIKLTRFHQIRKIEAKNIEVLKTYGSNKKLLKLIGDFKFTKFDDGLKKTYLWFVKNKKYLIN
jgi:UDP-glucuronate 4-epimerase